MSTYTQILYQIVFSTKHRKPCLQKSGREALFKYIWGVIQNKSCHLYRINGVEDHLHIALSLHPAVALAALVKDIKVSSNAFIQENDIFPGFEAWQEGYAAFTYSIKAKTNLIAYIKNQEAHHRKKDFKTELIELLKEHQIAYDEKYLD